jgi:hypothetical protein
MAQRRPSHVIIDMSKTRTVDSFGFGSLVAGLALALVDVGRERKAVAVALTALSEYLPRYNTSVAAYAQDLTTESF